MATAAGGNPVAAANVGGVERIGSAIVGAGLIAAALARLSLGGVAAVIGGVLLVRRGLTGDCPFYREIGVTTAPIDRPPRAVQSDTVLCASEDSFPASDPPAWTPVTGTLPRR